MSIVSVMPSNYLILCHPHTNSLPYYQRPPTRMVHLLKLMHLALTYHNHPKFIVYITLHSWCYTLYGFRHMYIDRYLSSWYQAGYCPKNPVFCLFIPLHPKPLENTDLFTVSTVLPFPEHHIVRLTWHVTFSNCLLLFNLNLW